MPRVMWISMFGLFGCTAIKAEVHLMSADQALTRAEAKNAKQLAPYEYTMSVRYFEKAREEAGYSDWRVAEDLAKTAAEWADKSIIAIEAGGRTLPVETPEGAVPVIPVVPPVVPTSTTAVPPAPPPPTKVIIRTGPAEPAPAPTPGTP